MSWDIGSCVQERAVSKHRTPGLAQGTRTGREFLVRIVAGLVGSMGHLIRGRRHSAFLVHTFCFSEMRRKQSRRGRFLCDPEYRDLA